MKNLVPYVICIAAVLFGIYAVLIIAVATVDVAKQMNWCEYKNGELYSSNSESTGKRWSPNVLTIGLTGECINPGDKGL